MTYSGHCLANLCFFILLYKVVREISRIWAVLLRFQLVSSRTVAKRVLSTFRKDFEPEEKLGLPKEVIFGEDKNRSFF